MPTSWVATQGLKGFDSNMVVSALDANAFRRSGYRFAIRYLPRIKWVHGDLAAAELKDIYLGGLGCMAVQHVESDKSWVPDAEKGRSYGQTAGAQAYNVGLELGTTVWLDLEGVALGTPTENVIQYCNYWHDRVLKFGYQPGLYVGWHSGLSRQDLFKRLKFTRYWSSYNLNVDQYPAVCGVCMKQGVSKPPNAVRLQIDTDFIVGDNLGRYPTLSVPDEWDPK